MLGHQGLCMCSGHDKSWLPKPKSGLKTLVPDCVGSATLPLLLQGEWALPVTSILLMGLVPSWTLLYDQKSLVMKISMEGVCSVLVTWEPFCSGWISIFSLKHPLFSLKQSLHLHVDANEKCNKVGFFNCKYFVSGLIKQHLWVQSHSLCWVCCSYFGFDFDHVGQTFCI